MIYCLTPTKEDFIRAVEIFERLEIPHCEGITSHYALWNYLGLQPLGVDYCVKSYARLSEVSFHGDRLFGKTQVTLDELEDTLKLLLL